MFEECPKCHSVHIRGEWPNFDDGVVWRTTRCNDCDFKWNEIYKFWRNEDVNTTEELNVFGDPIPGTKDLTS